MAIIVPQAASYAVCTAASRDDSMMHRCMKSISKTESTKKKSISQDLAHVVVSAGIAVAVNSSLSVERTPKPEKNSLPVSKI